MEMSVASPGGEFRCGFDRLRCMIFAMYLQTARLIGCVRFSAGVQEYAVACLLLWGVDFGLDVDEVVDDRGCSPGFLLAVRLKLLESGALPPALKR